MSNRSYQFLFSRISICLQRRQPLRSPTQPTQPYFKHGYFLPVKISCVEWQKRYAVLRNLRKTPLGTLRQSPEFLSSVRILAGHFKKQPACKLPFMLNKPTTEGHCINF